jgi:hypothetical protein
VCSSRGTSLTMAGDSRVIEFRSIGLQMISYVLDEHDRERCTRCVGQGS